MEVTDTFWAEVDYIEDYERIQAFLQNTRRQPLPEPTALVPVEQVAV